MDQDFARDNPACVFRYGRRPVGAAIMDSVLSKRIDDLEPTPMRHDYTVKVSTECVRRDRRKAFRPDKLVAIVQRHLDARTDAMAGRSA